jgi:ABC-2 type transport system ATP-binding protein
MNATTEIDGRRNRSGPAQALDEVTFTVRPGQVTGFAGPNGAGKPATMRVVVGLHAPGAGTATIGGQPYRTPKNPLRHVGTLLDAGALQPSRSARSQLLWLARSQALKSGRVDEVIALLSLGVAAAVRDSVAAIGLVLGLLYLFPIAAAVVSDATISRHLQQIGPLPASLDVKATIGVNSLPLTPWQGLSVVALCTAGALLLGAFALKSRDA